MGALRLTTRCWLLTMLSAAACGTTGTPEAAPRATNAICGLEDQVRRSMGLRDENLHPSELVLRLVDHASGGPLPDLALSLKGSAEVLGALDCRLKTDRYGVARARLAPTLYNVVLDRRDLVARTGAFYSGAQEMREVRIEKGGAITGRVLDERGKALPKVSVVIGGEDGMCGGLTDDNGGFRCEGLWSGEHSVTATVQDRAAVSRVVVLGSGQDLRGVDLTPLPGGVLVVRATCGGPCVGAIVSASIGDETREEQVGPDGIARLRDLPSGQARIYGYRDDPRGRMRATAIGVNVQAGRTVNATLELGHATAPRRRSP